VKHGVHPYLSVELLNYMTNSSASFDNQLIRSSANQPPARDSSRPIAATG
jgi:hypothetical protein